MIDGIPVANIGAGTLVVIFVLAILTGRLVPRKTLEDEREEKKTWRDAYFTERGQSSRAVDEGLALVLDALRSIKRVGEQGGDDG